MERIAERSAGAFVAAGPCGTVPNLPEQEINHQRNLARVRCAPLPHNMRTCTHTNEGCAGDGAVVWGLKLTAQTCVPLTDYTALSLAGDATHGLKSTTRARGLRSAPSTAHAHAARQRAHTAGWHSHR